MIYLDNGATSWPKPLQVRRAFCTALEKYGANPGRSGHALSRKTAEAVYRVRKKAADFFGGRPEQVMFPLNCTQALNFALKGSLRPGDHVITSCLEHNAVMRPLEALKARGVAYSCADLDVKQPGTIIASMGRLLRRNTRMVVVTAGSNVCGIRLPLREIGVFCKKHRLLFCVDAAQGAGVIPIHAQELGIDFLCVAPHKGLYAPMGTGLLLARAPLRPIIEGGTGLNSMELVQPADFPERLESGTINTPGVIALGSGIDFVREMGLGKIYAHEMKMIQSLYDYLCQCPNVVMYTPRPDESFCLPLICFNIGSLHSEETAEYLDQEGFALRAGLHCAPAAHRKLETLEQGTVRVCPSVFTKEEEMFALAEKIENFAKKHPITH